MAISPRQKPNNNIDDIHARLDAHEERISTLENIATELSSISDTVERIFKYMKIAGPSIVSAAVAAGLVNGKLAEFFKALFTY